jgi:hypothetical protein
MSWKGFSPGRPTDAGRLARERLENLIDGLTQALGWRSYRIPRGRGVAGFPNYIMLRDNRMVVVFLATSWGPVNRFARPWLEDFNKVEFLDVVVWRNGDEETPEIELDRTARRGARRRYSSREKPPGE